MSVVRTSDPKRIVVIYSPGLGGPWLSRLVEAAQESRHHFVHVVIGSPNRGLLKTLERLQVPVEQIAYGSRIHALRALRDVHHVLKVNRASTVHTHGHEASAIGLLAARIAGVQERIYTRHHSTMNHEGGPFYASYYDHLCNHLSTKIIATSNIVRECLMGLEGVPEDKIWFQSYRIDLAEFSDVDEERIARIRESYDIQSDVYAVGMISRFVWWKGVEFGVAAFRQFREAVPNALLVLTSAIGPWSEQIQGELEALPVGSYRLIPFEQDVAALYRTLDVVMHLPVSRGIEAWGQVYVEALAAGVPLVCTESGVACSSLLHQRDCLMVPYRDAAATKDALLEIHADPELRQRLVDGGLRSIQRFAFSPDDQLIDEQYEE